MISFTNKRSNKIQTIKNLQNISSQIGLINLARLRKQNRTINKNNAVEQYIYESNNVEQNIDDSNNVEQYIYDSNNVEQYIYDSSSVYDINSYNGDVVYLSEKEEPISNFRQYVLMLDAKYRNNNNE